MLADETYDYVGIFCIEKTVSIIAQRKREKFECFRKQIHTTATEHQSTNLTRSTDPAPSDRTKSQTCPLLPYLTGVATLTAIAIAAVVSATLSFTVGRSSTSSLLLSTVPFVVIVHAGRRNMTRAPVIRWPEGRTEKIPSGTRARASNVDNGDENRFGGRVKKRKKINKRRRRRRRNFAVNRIAGARSVQGRRASPSPRGENLSPT